MFHNELKWVDLSSCCIMAYDGIKVKNISKTKQYLKLSNFQFSLN